MSAICEGTPLDEVDLDGFDIVDEDGDTVGPFEGFIAFPGETMLEAISRSLPAGCSIIRRERVRH